MPKNSRDTFTSTPVRAKIVADPGEFPRSSCRTYAGEVFRPHWLHIEFILSLFGGNDKTAKKRYGNFVEGSAGLASANPFENVRASTLLGSESFVKWVRENFLNHGKADRELPALRQLADRPVAETIRTAVDALLLNDPAMRRRVGMYLCRRYTGLKLKEIGTAYAVGESAVTQASRRVVLEMKGSESLRKAV